MLNLETKCKDEEIIKEYLEQNASEELKTNINNGTPFSKDGKTFINKKTLSGFIDYAHKQARELAEKGKQYAMVKDDVVFGWAIHYFEEETIEEKLYCLDGTEYIPPKKEVKTTTTTSTIIPKKEEKPQLSFFDIYNDKKQENIEEETQEDEVSEEEVEEAMEELTNGPSMEQTTIKEEVKTTSPAYSNYLNIQSQYPTDIIVYRLGDFYEAFNENAKKIANILDLTITSRAVGLPERIPMVGFPYHIADKYISKLNENGFTIVKAESLQDITVIKPDTQKHWINDTTYVDEDGTVHEVSSSFNNEIIDKLKNIIGDIFICTK